jgi:hypothetical protein
LLGNVELFGYIPTCKDQVAGDVHVSVKLASGIALAIDSRPFVGEVISRYPGGPLSSRVPLYTERSLLAVSPDRRRTVCSSVRFSINADPGLADSGDPGTEGVPQHPMAARCALALAKQAHPGLAFTPDGRTLIGTDDRVIVEIWHDNRLLSTEEAGNTVMSISVPLRP